MLRIIVPASEQWDEKKQEFITTKQQTLQLEHSLVSLSKWESKWCKPFLSDKEKTFEETIDYIRYMTLTQNVDPNVYTALTKENIVEIQEYIKAPMTATTFKRQAVGHNGEQITSELIYYWMVALNIPFECQKWHLNRLITLVKVCEIKNQPAKTMSRRNTMNQNAALNAARRSRMHSRG